MNPKIKSLLAVSIFSLIGIISFVMNLENFSLVLPPFIFYVLLIINTYFSLKLFFAIIPATLTSQIVIDGILGVFYILFALTFANPFYFSLFIAVFFGLSAVKYAKLRGVVNQPRLLRRKIIANTLGSLLGLLVFIGISFGFMTISLWGLVIIFALANVYLFFISPLYVLDTTV